MSTSDEIEDFLLCIVDFLIAMSNKTMRKSKKLLTLKEKLEVLRRCDAGEKRVEISRALSLPSSTVRSICNRDAGKLKVIAKHGMLTSIKQTRTRSNIYVKMESLLCIWIQDKNRRKMPLNQALIRSKAKSLFEELKLKPDFLSDKDEIFEASQGWFDRFRTRAGIRNVSLKGEAASGDKIAAENFKTEFKAIVQSGGYSQRQIFNVDETGLFWKRLPRRTYISEEEKSASGFKQSKNRLTLLLGGNAAGDFKFKPFLIYNSENPRAMKAYSKSSLPVHWRSNKKAWMTGNLFRDWVSNCAIPEIRAYSAKENIAFKALILLDNAPSHPVDLDETCDNVQFVFAPPNTTALIQPMDQGVISNFKAYYLRRTFKQLFAATDESEVGMKEFWKDYHIMKAIENISKSWEEVKSSCMNGCWRNIWPECVQGGTDTFDETVPVLEEISVHANHIGFEGAEIEDLTEVLASHDEELSNEDLINLDQSESPHEVPTQIF